MADTAPRRTGTLAALAIGTLVLVAATARPVSAQENANAALAAVQAAQADYASTGAEVARLTLQLDDLQEERAALDRERDGLSAEQRDAVGDFESARGLAETYVIEAYMSGTESEMHASMLNPDTSGDELYRNELLRVNSVRTREVVHDYAETRKHVDDQLESLVDTLAANQRDIDQVRADLEVAQQRWADADRALREADRVATDLDLASLPTETLPDGTLRIIGYVGSGSDGGPTPAQSGNAFGVGWDQLRHCESGGNYAAVSPGGTYRGAYQFDVTTWRGMGGDGDPALARPAEQDYRAQLLYNMRGAQPWPVCGRYLLADPNIKPHPATPPPPPGTWIPPSWVPPLPGTKPVLPVPTTKPTTTTTAPEPTTTTTAPPTTTTTTKPVTTTTTKPVTTTTTAAPP